MTDFTLGFIGGGHMNSAIIKGILDSNSKILNRKMLFVSSKTAETSSHLQKEFNIQTTTDNTQVIEKAQYIVIGVKPQQMHDLLIELAEYDLSETTLITVAAGIHIADYRKILGDEVTIVRTMPNMAAAYQCALTGIYCDSELDEETERVIEEIFSSIGSIAWLDDETQIDGITALSGSGIAYFFSLMQAMMTAGEQYGFEKEELYDIISLTALGAATLTLETEGHNDFTHFVKKIAIEGGTTIQAIHTFEKEGLDKTISAAMQAVVARSNQLTDELTKGW